MNFIKLLIVTIIIFTTNASYADENPSWEADKIKLEKLVSDGKCDQYWNLLWPWAKEGNLEARNFLFVISAMQLHSPEVYPPGRSGDIISHLRDIIILMIHSLPENEKSQQRNRELEESFTVELNNNYRAKDFLKCWESHGNQSCADIAVTDKLIPSWESYAAEIDALIDKGLPSLCFR